VETIEERLAHDPFARDHHLRGTGRTTRMLKAALDEARKGKYVLVYALNLERAKEHFNQCYEMAEMEEIHNGTLGQKFRLNCGGEISFDQIPAVIDWERMYYFVAPGVQVFVDHACIEHRWSAMITELRRFEHEAYGG